MMNRAQQNWPDDETVEIPAETEHESGQHTGSTITDLINVVEQTDKKGKEKA